MIDDDRDNPRPAVPEWMISFADMMALLLTFFVMLMSFSEPRKDERFLALASHFKKQFGKDATDENSLPAGAMPVWTQLAAAVSEDEARRELVSRQVHASWHAEDEMDPSQPLATLYFADRSLAISNHARDLLGDLRADASQQQTIEIRSVALPADRADRNGAAGEWDRAYQRGRAVLAYLTEQGDFSPEKLQLAIVLPSEKESRGNPPARRGSARVELYLHDRKLGSEVVAPAARTAALHEQQD